MQVTDHARKQMTRRRIRPRHLELTLRFGQERHCAGATFFVLRGKDIPRALQRDPEVRRAEGTTLVTQGNTITTAYRNPDIGHLRRKPLRSRSRRRPRPPRHASSHRQRLSDRDRDKRHTG